MSIMKSRGAIFSSELEEDVGATCAFEKEGERRVGRKDGREGEG